MRLVVLDTNVIVSAGIKSTGAPAMLLMDWVLEGQVQAVTCPTVAREYRAVTRRSKFTRYDFPPLWLEFLIDESLQLEDPPKWPHGGPHKEDLIFLALAQASGAWLVTGNLRHFPERDRHGVKVISPADYLGSLTTP